MRRLGDIQDAAVGKGAQQMDRRRVALSVEDNLAQQRRDRPRHVRFFHIDQHPGRRVLS
jgi:hypothetical protein